MATLPWIDFTVHNSRTQENVRAFSVNHPQAGRLVVIKGVEPPYEALLQGMGFTLTQDGSFVIQASNLNMRQLQSQVYPSLQLLPTELRLIDLTEQFLNPRPSISRAVQNPGMEFLLYSQQPTQEEGLSRYAGPIPSAAAISLWSYLEDSAEATKHPNGQIHYRGVYRDQPFIVQRRQRLLSDIERVIFHSAPTAELLPDLGSSSQAPELFRLSDNISTELQIIDAFYGATVNGERPDTFVVDRHLGGALAQRAINASEALEGQLLTVQFPTANTLVLADARHETALSVRHLTDIMGGDETNALLIDLPEDGWVTMPESVENPAASSNARIKGAALAKLPGLMISAESRGFTALAYYQEEPLSADLPAPEYVSSDSVPLYIRALPRTEVLVQRQSTLVNQNRIPEGYVVEYGQGEREGSLRLVFEETGEPVSDKGNVWFHRLDQAVAALSLPENTPFVAPDLESIEDALNEAFLENSTEATQSGPIEVIAYRGEHGSLPEADTEAIQTRLGSVSFGSKEVAHLYAVEPNNRSDQVISPRIIEARIRIERPVGTDPNDPFIELSTIIAAVGEERAREIVADPRIQAGIMNTDNWQNILETRELPPTTTVGELLESEPQLLPELYCDAYLVLDEPRFVAWFKEAGYDGAAHGGNGGSAGTTEYKVFSREQVEILSTSAIDLIQTQPTQTTNMPTESAVDPALEPEQIRRSIENHLKMLRIHADTAITKTPAERAAYLSAHRGRMTLALQELPRLAETLREQDPSAADILNGRIPDLTELEDPVLTEVMAHVLDEDVTLELDTLATDQATRATQESANERPKTIVPGTQIPFGEQALVELSHNTTFEDAGITFQPSNRGRGFDVYYTQGVTVQVGHVSRIHRSTVITGILTHRGHPTDPTPTLIEEYRRRDNLPLGLRKLVDEAYSGRTEDVTQSLINAGYNNINEATDGQGVAITCNVKQEHVGSVSLLQSVEWVVGETTLHDDLELTVDELAEAVIATAAAIEQAQADTALEGDESAIFDRTWPKNPQNYSIESFDTIVAAQEALARGDIIDVYGEEIYVRPSSSGWVLKVRQDGTTANKADGLSRQEAIENASSTWNLLPHFRSTNAAVTENPTLVAEAMEHNEASERATENHLLAEANKQVEIFSLAQDAIDFAHGELENLSAPRNADQSTLDAYNLDKSRWEGAIEILESTLITAINPFELIEREELPEKIRTQFESRFSDLSPDQMGESALQARREIINTLRGTTAPDTAGIRAEAMAESRRQSELDTSGFIPFGNIRSARSHIENLGLNETHQAVVTVDGAVVRPRKHLNFDINATATLPGDILCKTKKEAIDVLSSDPDRYSHIVKRGSQWIARPHNTGTLYVPISPDTRERELYKVWTTAEGKVASQYPVSSGTFGPAPVTVEADDLVSLIHAMQDAPRLERELIERIQRDNAHRAAERAAVEAQKQQQYAEEEQALGGIRLEELSGLDLAAVKNRIQRKKTAGNDTSNDERKLRTLRQNIFEAEDAMRSAYKQRNPSLFDDYKELFPLAAKRLALMPQPAQVATTGLFNISAVIRNSDGEPFHVNIRRGNEAVVAPFVDGRPEIGDENPTVDLNSYTFSDEWWDAERGLILKHSEFPLGNVTTEDEDRYYGSRVIVRPGLHADEPIGGVIARVLNGGRLIEVIYDKVNDASESPRFRVSGERITLLEVIDQKEERSQDKLNDQSDVPETVQAVDTPTDEQAETGPDALPVLVGISDGLAVETTDSQMSTIKEMIELANSGSPEVEGKILSLFRMTGDSIYVGLRSQSGKPISVTEIETDGRPRRSDPEYLLAAFDDQRKALITREQFDQRVEQGLASPAQAQAPSQTPVETEAETPQTDSDPQGALGEIEPPATDDLFGTQAYTPSTSTATFVIEPGANDKQFIVSGNALMQPAITQELESRGGRYIKKYAGYRFKADKEASIRSWLKDKIESGQFRLDERIRTPFEVKTGAILPSGEVIRSVGYSSITDSVRITYGPLKRGNVFAEILFTTDIPGLELVAKVTVTNADELMREALAEKVAELQSETETQLVNPEPTSLPEAEPAAEPADRDTEAPALRAITGGTVPEHGSNDAKAKPLPRERMLRGKAVRLLGKNTQGQALYADKHGLRYTLSANGDLTEETPVLGVNDESLPPANRTEQFMLPSEASVAAASEGENIVPLFSPDQKNTETLVGENLEKAKAVLEEIGYDNEFATVHLQAYAAMMDYVDGNPGADLNKDFTYRRLQQELNKVEVTLASKMRSAGYQPRPEAFDYFRRQLETVRSEYAATIESIVDQTTARAIQELPTLNIENVLKITREQAQALTPAWLNECLERLPAPARALLIAKAYGSEDEIEAMTLVVNDQDAEAREAFSKQIEDKYEKHRILVELPERISILSEFIASYSGLSPIPRVTAEDERRILRTQLLQAQFDIDSMPIDDQDKANYREHYALDDAALAAANRHGISIDAAYLFNRRVSEAISEDLRREYLATDEVAVGLDVPDALRALSGVPDDLYVDTIINTGESSHRIPWGSGDVSVSFPKYDEALGGFAVHYRYNSQHRHYDASATQVYATLPSAEIIARDTASLLERYQTPLINANKVPGFGAKRDTLPEGMEYQSKDIAKLIRQDINEAIKSGALPKGLKVSISLARNLDPIITALPEGFELINPEYLAYAAENPHDYHQRPPYYTHEAMVLIQALEGYTNAYNYDNSDPMSDFYNRLYGGSVSVDYELKKATEDAIKARGAITPQSDLESRIYTLLEASVYNNLHQLYQIGFVYIDGRDEPVRLAPDDPSANDNGFANHIGVIVDVDGLDPMFVLAANRLKDAYGLIGRPFFEATKPEQSDEGVDERTTQDEELLILAREAIEALDVEKVVNSGRPERLILAPQFFGLPTLELQVESQRLILTNGDVPEAIIETNADQWRVLEITENANTLFRDIAENNYRLGTTQQQLPPQAEAEPGNIQSYHPEPEPSNDIHNKLFKAVLTAGMDPKPIPSITSVGAHFIGAKRNAVGQWGAVLATSTVAGENRGIVIEGDGFSSYESALTAVAKRYEEYAKHAYRHNQAPGMCDAISVLTYLEGLIEQNRGHYQAQLLDAELRAIAQKGGISLVNHYEDLVSRQGAAPSDSDIVSRRVITLISSSDHTEQAQIELAQLASGHFVFGADITLPNGRRVTTEATPENDLYISAEQAAGAFLKTIDELAPQMLNRCAKALYSEVPIARTADRDLPEIDANQAFQEISGLEARIQELENQIRLGDASVPAIQELIGERDRLEVERDGYQAVITFVTLQNNPLATLDISPEGADQYIAPYRLLREAYNAARIQEVQNTAPESKLLRQQWLDATALSTTHEVTETSIAPREDLNLPERIGQLQVIERYRNNQSNPIYLIQTSTLDPTLSQVLVSQARLSGGLELDGELIFSDLASLEEFVEENTLQYRIQEHTLNEPEYQTVTANANIEPGLIRQLHEAGYIQTESPHAWVVQAEGDVSIRVEFYRGVGNQTIDARVKIAGPDFRRETYIAEQPEELSANELTDKLNAELQAVTQGKILTPTPAPSISTITGEKACAMVLAAGMNIEQRHDQNTWVVSGDTFARRNTLYNLGGKFHNPGTGKAVWVFRENPVRRLAAALAGQVESQEAVQLHKNGFILKAGLLGNDNHFVVRGWRDDSDQNDEDAALILAATSSLSGARTSTLDAVLEPGRLEAIFSKHDAQKNTKQGNTGSAQRSSAENTSTNKQQTPVASVEAQSAQENERATGGDRRVSAAGNDASADQQQPRMGPESGADIPANMAHQGRGADRDGGGASGPAIPRAQGRPTVADRSQTVAGSSPSIQGRSDGQVLRNAKPRKLFNLRDAQPKHQLNDEARSKYVFDALNTLLTLRSEKRSATDEERQALARFVGLGAKQFNTSEDGVFKSRAPYSKETPNKRIADLMSSFLTQERDALQSTVLTAFYTPSSIRRFFWQALERMGVNDQLSRLDVVEPAAGIGHFIGDAPDYVRNGARIQAVEIDPITAEIAKHLYPEAQVINKPFQDVQFPANSKDLFIGNPPYSDVRTFNPATGKREVIHDLFLRESIKSTRPGGIVAFVTSSGTMDKVNDEMRVFVASHADLVHAVRLPNSAFEEAGTEVMTDILFFRKRLPNELPRNANWTKTTPKSFTYIDKSVELTVNQYFVDNPQNVIGELKAVPGRFGPTLRCEYSGDLGHALSEQLARLPEGIFNPQLSVNRRTDAAVSTTIHEEVGEELMQKHRIGSWYLDESGQIRLIQYDGEQARYFSEVVKLNTKQSVIAKDYVVLRDLAKSLVEAESAPTGEVAEEELERIRAKVNERYDQFVQIHGPVNQRAVMRIIQADPDAYFVAALENYDKDLDQAEKADILKHRVIRAVEKISIITAEDALYSSMSQFGHVDPAYVEQALSRPWHEVEAELGEQIFFDPESGKYTTPAIYLSGDVVHKREVAERALIDNLALERNIEALKAATPKPIPITDIHLKLGATWIPEDIIQDFARTLVNARHYPHSDRLTVTFNDLLKEWQVTATAALVRDKITEFTIESGTPYVPFHKLLAHSLNQTRPRVYTNGAEGQREISEEETQHACDKQIEIEEKFRSWVLEDSDRARQVQDAYNYRLNRFVRPEPDGLYLTFPGIAEEFKGRPLTLDPHQLGVIERALTSPYGTLIAHEAGGGKTISTAAIAIKHKQLGLAQKPMIAVPNHMLVQYTKETLELYPNARILTVNKADLTPKGRELFAQKCRLNDWDLVICTHSQYQRMSMPAEYVERDMRRQLDDLETMLIESDDRLTTKDLERRKKNLEEKLKAIAAKIEKGSDDIDFTQLGVDFIAYDEGHYLKNLDLPTKNSGLAGINTRDAVRSRDSLMKFDWIRESRGDGKGVVLATGTPISNTVGEIMVMMRYLAPDLLERAGIYDLDQFIANFGHIKTHLELTPDGSSYQTKDRLSGFRNIPELMRLFTQGADIKVGDQLNLKRPSANRVTHVTELTPEQSLFMDWLGHRARLIKAGMVKPSKDNMLKIYTDLRKASVDMRLVHHKLADHPESKVNKLVETMYQRWQEGSDNLDTQLLFLDFIRQSTKVEVGAATNGKPKFKTVENFNLYKDIKKKLVAKGIPAHEIAFIHDAKTDDEKEQLFEQIRAGKVRITIASTEKMGVGTNVQTRLKDIYHGSLPLRSTDMEQRNKRAVRQGNMHDSVNIHYPVTRGSGDLVSLQMLDRKSKMEKQIMECDFENMLRSFDDDIEPTYEEIMALTTNNPIIKEKIETDIKVEELRRKRRGHEQSAYAARRSLKQIENDELPLLQMQLENVRALRSTVGELPEQFEMTVNGKKMTKYSHVGAAAHNAWAEMGAYVSEKEIGNYHGLPIKVVVDNIGTYLVAVAPGKGQYISVGITNNLSAFPSYLASKVKERYHSLNVVEAHLEDAYEQAARLKSIVEAPFEHEQELNDLIKRQTELNIEFAKWEKENKVDVNQESYDHPFAILLKKLDGEDITQRVPQGALSAEEIQQALAAEEMASEQEKERGPKLTLV